MKVGFSFGGREEKERKRWCGVVCGEVRRVEMEFYMGELRRSHVLICAVNTGLGLWLCNHNVSKLSVY